jgi:methionine-rich copper-binding protein CopC
MSPLLSYRRRASLALAGATVLLASCTPGDGVGLDANGRPPAESGAGQPPVTSDANAFRVIQDTIFTPVCTACHAGASAPMGLRLDSANAYAMLVNVPSAQVSSLRRINPGDPTNSYLLQKVEGRAAVGSRMPLGGGALPQASIDLLRNWIAAGAKPPASSLMAPDSLQISSSIPANGEVSVTAVNEITVIFSEPLDIGAATAVDQVQLIAEGTGERVAVQSIALQEGNDSVLKVRTAAALAPGSYELRLNGSGALRLAGASGRLLSNDFSAAFLVTVGGAP